MLFKKPEKIEKIDASSITGGLYLKVDANGKIIGATVSGGGGSLESVATYNDLPSAPAHIGEYYIVDTTTGTWILGTKKSAGIYKSNGTIWIYIDNVPETTSLSDGTTTITGTNIILQGSGSITTQTDALNNKIVISAPSVPTKTSDITNDSGFIVTETDPVFSASQAHNITSTHITVLNNTSGINTGDETQTSIINKLGYTPLALNGDGSSLTGLLSGQISHNTSYASFSSSTNQNVNAGVTTKYIYFDSVAADQLSEFSIANQKLTIAQNGLYMIFTKSYSASAGNLNIYVYRNGSNLSSTYQSTLANGGRINSFIIYPLSQGDVIEFYVNSSVTNAIGLSGFLYKMI